MSKSSSSFPLVGTGLLPLLFVVFLVLRLTGVIAWSWWWVTAPLWGPLALAVALVLVLLLIKIFIQKKKR